MSTKSVMLSNHLILCCPLLFLPSIFPSIRVFSTGSVLPSGGQSIGASASASVPPVNIQGWFHLGLTGLISLQFKGLSRVFSNTTVWKHSILQCSALFMAQFSLFGPLITKEYFYIINKLFKQTPGCLMCFLFQWQTFWTDHSIHPGGTKFVSRIIHKIAF